MRRDNPPIKTKADARAIELGYYFDEHHAERVREFFRKFLRLNTGKKAGKPFDLLDWQYDGVIRPLFGWRAPDDTRRFRRAYLSTPKKNGKTPLLAGIGCYLITADGEPAAEVYSAAADREQAGLIYREAAGMVEQSPALSGILTTHRSTKTITAPKRSFFRALSAEAKTKEGLNAHGVLFDELHAQTGRELWDCLAYAIAARKEPLFLSITTAGGDMETICGEQYQYAKGILDGTNDSDLSFFAFIAEAAMSDDWSLETTWRKANPSYGITISEEQFKADFNEAREVPAKENSFRRYRLNQWVQTADAWLSMDQWDSCDTCGGHNGDYAELAGRECTAGLDLSATDDTTALVLAFDDPDGGVSILPFFWLPEDNIDALERKHKVNYRAWAKSGFFNLTPGNVVDYSKIREKLRELAKVYKIKELCIDRKFQGQGLENDLVEDGFNVVPAGQGWISQDLPAKELEKMLKGGKIRHGINPVMRWHASNVVVDIDKNDNYTINKKKSRSKIDGIAALIMALFAKMRHGGPADLYVNGNPTLTLL